MANNLGISDALLELVFTALDHGIGSIEQGGPMVPPPVLSRSHSATM